jgi:hypothetical protein
MPLFDKNIKDFVKKHLEEKNIKDIKNFVKKMLGRKKLCFDPSSLNPLREIV